MGTLVMTTIGIALSLNSNYKCVHKRRYGYMVQTLNEYNEMRDTEC